MSWIAKDILTAVAALAEDNPCVTLDQLESHTQLERNRIIDSANILVKRGFIKRSGRGCYQLTESGTPIIATGMAMKSGPKGRMPRQKTRGLRQKAWHVIRNKRKFTLDDIKLTICQGDERNAHSNLSKYLRSLVQAGYLKILPRKVQGNGPTSNGRQVYLLVSDTGRLGPVWRQTRNSLFDPNTGEEHPLPDKKC
jgi:predicted transcriptional regulator